jgi:HK97 family phage prohead protease
MNIIRKDATITNTDEDFPGAFEVVLSTATKDRDGDELAPEDWQQPLPDHITFDVDHGMSVEKTIGSGVPSIEDGKLIVRGTYSSLPRAQEVRTLVKEGHIRTTSVAFSSKKSTKDGATRTTRELLNGAFVAIPANTEAVVLSAKAGARNSTADQKNLQAAHDAVVAVGAICAGPEDSSGAEEGSEGGKSYDYAGDLRTKSLDEWRADWNADVATKALSADDTVSISLTGYAGGFSASVSTWSAPALEIDAWADTAQNALASALQILSGGPVDDDGDEAETKDVNEETTPNADEKSADADALDLQMLALRVIASAHIG